LNERLRTYFGVHFLVIVAIFRQIAFFTPWYIAANSCLYPAMVGRTVCIENLVYDSQRFVSHISNPHCFVENFLSTALRRTNQT
jgi:hypothetical protein